MTRPPQPPGPALDAEGLPLPWVPAEPRSEGLSAPGDREGDAVSLGEGDPEPEPEGVGERAEPWLREELEALCGLADLRPPELLVQPISTPRRGFCGGRIWLRDGRPLRILLRPAPNSDRAELLATLAHEVAHPLAWGAGHGAAFRAALLDLSGRRWGATWFESADPAGSYLDVDRWLATGLRARLAEREPPRPRTGDEGQTARIVARIRKLHALADHRPGEPEAITAAGRANDLVTVYGLGRYQVEIDAGIDEQMVDRWVLLDRRSVWNRRLCASVARYFSVFPLAMARAGRMHFFGRYADVVATVYLVEISRDKILRACDRHIAAWKAEAPRTGGAVRSERVRFCDNAVHAFGRKLAAARTEGGEEALLESERFAAREHRRRGERWTSGRGRVIAQHAAGQAAGEALEVVRGLGGGRVPRRLGGG